MCKNDTDGWIDAGIFIFIKRKNIDGSYSIFCKTLTAQERIDLDADGFTEEFRKKIINNGPESMHLIR